MSATEVVNVKVAYIRPRYENLKVWCEDPENVYIGRKGIVFIESSGIKERYPKEDSLFANPFKVGDGGVQEAVDKYRIYIKSKIESGDIRQEDIEFLRGKRLGCWCKEPGKEKPCHGDVLIELLEQK